MSISPTQEPGWNSCDDCKRRNILSNDGTCTNDAALPNRHTRQNNCAGAYIGRSSYTNRFYFQVGLDNWHIYWYTGMGRTQNLGARSPANVVFQDEITRVEVGLRPDPHVAPNSSRSIKSPLNVSLRSDENAVTDLEGLKMFEPNAAANANTMTKLLRHSSPDSPAHEIVQLAIPVGEPGIKFHEYGR